MLVLIYLLVFLESTQSTQTTLLGLRHAKWQLKSRQWPVASVWQQHLEAGQHLTGQSIALNRSAASERKKYALVIYGDSGSLCEANLNTSFVQNIFHITELERKPNLKHHSQADGLRARL